MSEYSFDIVSKFDHQEVDNALGQTNKELGTRYDFRGMDASVDWKGKEQIEIKAINEDRVKAAKDVLIEKLVRRGIDIKTLEIKEITISGKTAHAFADLQQGIPKESASKIGKIIRDEAPKGVKSQVNGDEIRVTSKSRDDLQTTIALLKSKDLPVALQFVNFR